MTRIFVAALLALVAGCSSPAGALAPAPAPVAAGALYDSTGAYTTILVVLGIGSVAGAVASAALPPSSPLHVPTHFVVLFG